MRCVLVLAAASLLASTGLATSSIRGADAGNGRRLTVTRHHGAHYRGDVDVREDASDESGQESGPAFNNAAGTRVTASKNLTNYGGPVLKNVQVIPVYWNSAVTFQANLNTFYADYVSAGSSLITLMSQYSGIGAGTAAAGYVDTQVAVSVTDAQLQTYLSGLITAGKVPAPNANTYYPIHFPPGVSIAGAGSTSCVAWCAYHGTYVRNGVNVNYGVIPELTNSGCAGGCGTNTAVNNLYSVSSHELAEAMTDPAVGLATVYAPPLAWYNKAGGEIGDLCNAQQATVTMNGNAYSVQKMWSNAKYACATA